MKKLLLTALMTAPLLFACNSGTQQGSEGGPGPVAPPEPDVSEPAQIPGHLDIIYLFDPAVPKAVQANVRKMEAMMERIITSPLNPYGDQYGCSELVSSYKDPRKERALVISVEYSIPPNSHLGLASSCEIDRKTRLPHAGYINLSSTLHELDDPTQQTVIMHETLHTMGLGSRTWGSAGTHLKSPLVLKNYAALGGGNDGAPLDEMRAHWNRSSMGMEAFETLITIRTNKRQPLSIVTLSALADLGWPVDLSKAEPYTLTVRGQSLPSLGTRYFEEPSHTGKELHRH